ncbi:MAG: septum formation protein Maf [Chlamydiae bacterium CG10_big_fil_rev_8_21_14_0_10_42_34]|nr:MAG: septum formation protein Maf [Chlamydiae bacterium CG10_big_fil_rev_8_21_14_0_10_42_34]
MQLILGSSSPRRREILNFFSVPFQQANPDFDETQVVFNKDPVAFVTEVAKRKALCLVDKYPEDVILTADTVVFRENRIFLKPESLEEAHAMLKELSGKEHQVFTGICVIKKNKTLIDSEESRVFFHELTDSQIRAYHNHFLPLDKAGGYAIQKGGSLIVKRIEGCYYNIMGLPIHTVRSLLLKVGIDLWDYLKSI